MHQSTDPQSCTTSQHAAIDKPEASFLKTTFVWDYTNPKSILAKKLVQVNGWFYDLQAIVVPVQKNKLVPLPSPCEIWQMSMSEHFPGIKAKGVWWKTEINEIELDSF